MGLNPLWLVSLYEEIRTQKTHKLKTYHVRTYQESGHLQAKETSLKRSSANTLILNF